MKLNTLTIVLLISILTIGCMPSNINVETPQPSQTEQKQETKPTEVKKTELPKTTASAVGEKPVTYFEPTTYPAAEKEYEKEGIILEARNERYKIRINADIRTVTFTAPKSAFHVGDKVSFMETGTGEVKDVKKISSIIVPEERGSYKELFKVSEETEGYKIYERRGIITYASPTRYVVRDDQNQKDLIFFSDHVLDIKWGDRVLYRIDDHANVLSVRITSKYLLE